MAREDVVDEQLHFPAMAAAGYDAHVGQYTGGLVPRLLEIARLSAGQTVLDVATGTGVASAAAATVVGNSGAVVATDISPHMLSLARERLAAFQHSLSFVEDGQALSFPDQSFDAVLCHMGLMYFPDPDKGVREFYRVLRNNGRATVSVFHGSGPLFRLSSGRQFQGVATMIAARDPSNARHSGDFMKIGARVADLFAKAGFREIESQAYSGLLVMPNLDGYVQGIEAGAGSAGAEFLAVASEVREAVRAALHELVREANGEEVKVIVPVMFASGLR
jgi:ubiquinone/menaquinone biosynthesis C-methylase UbiE